MDWEEEDTKDSSTSDSSSKKEETSLTSNLLNHEKDIFQEKVFTQENQYDPVPLSKVSENNDDNLTLEKKADSLPNPETAPRDELATLGFISESSAGSKTTEEVLLDMEIDNEKVSTLTHKKDKNKKGKNVQDKNQARPSSYKKLRNEGLSSQT